MEIFVLFIIGAIGAFWWLNYITSKRNKDTTTDVAPYKVEPAADPKPAEPVAVAPQPAQPVVEPQPEAKAKVPAKAKKVKTPTASKTVVRKPRAAKAK